jgi:hypothetical protein
MSAVKNITMRADTGVKWYQYYALVVLIALIGGLSCNKKSLSGPVDYLTASSWKMKNLEVKVGTTGTWSDEFSTINDCRKDDEWSFFNNGTYQISEGPQKCSQADPQIIKNGTWNFLSIENRIKFGDPLDGEWKIEKLDAIQFIVTYSQDVGPATYYFRRTFSH